MMTIDREKYLDAREVKLLRAVTENRCTQDLKRGRQAGVRAWMLVDFALQTGLRVSEIARVKVEDINFKRGCLTVVRSKKKNTKPETLALGADLLEHLKEYVEDRKKGTLFIGERGDMTTRGLQALWKSACKAADLPESVSIHCARHTLAVTLLKKTGNLRAVQKQLGHADPKVTAAMYADISFEDMQDNLTNLYQ